MGAVATRLHSERRGTSRIVKSASGVLAAALFSTVAQASAIVSGSTVTAVSGGSPGAYTLTYNVYNGRDQNGDLDGISLIDIPELDLGDLVFVNLPKGW